MSKCQLTIALDKGPRAYRSGETVAGTVHVQVNKDVQCKELRIELYWQTSGKGSKDKQVIESMVEQGHDWAAGVLLDYPFSFQLPRGPLTYHGRYLKVDYYVSARADIPWAIDSKAVEEIVVLPGTDAESEPPDASDNIGPDEAHDKAKRLIDLLPIRSTFGLVVSVGALLLLLLYFFPFGALILVLALFFHRKGIATFISERRLGKVTLDTGPSRFSPGETMPIHLRFNTTERIQVNAMTATLIGREVCSSGSDDDTRTYTHTLQKESIQLNPSNPNEFYGELRIPDTDAYSFKSPDNEIEWHLDVHVEVQRWPNWSESRPILIVPRKT